MTKERVFYLRDERGNRVACVVSELDTETNFVRFAVSTWNNKDDFSTQVARQVAFGRLTKIHDPQNSERGTLNEVVAHGMELLTRYQGMRLYPTDKTSIKKEILMIIAEQKAFPAKTRKAAQLWLDKQAAKAAA
jgi:hypothetical protein